MPPVFVVLVTTDGVTTVWSTSPRTLDDAVAAARSCAACNPDKTWSAITYGPVGLPVVIAAVPRG